MARASQTTFGMIKPHGLGHIDFILSGLEKNGLIVVAGNFTLVSSWLADQHYQEHRGRPYFPTLMSQLQDKVVYAMIIQGVDAVDRWRKLMGPFRESERIAGTIRGQLMKPGDPESENFVHGADSLPSAAREIRLWKPRLSSFGADKKYAGDWEIASSRNGIVYGNAVV